VILHTNNCRFCNQDIKSIISFGKMPIANGFIDKKDLDSEYFYNLEVAFCTNCSLFQLIEMPDPKILFNQNYAYHSGQSKFMQSHFKDIAKTLINKYNLKINQFCVEIGNNDGGIVEYLNELGYNHLGVDPATNVYNIAKSKGINVLNDYFSFDVAKKISKDYKKADFILAANALSHIPDLQSVFSGIENLLSDDGIFITEDPYLIDVLKKNSYDQIYDEHVYIFSTRSVKNIFSKYGFELIEVKSQPTHGGSMRYVLARNGKRSISKSVEKQLNYEDENNLHLKGTYDLFRERCELSRKNLIDILQKQNSNGRRVVGYAATSKSTTVLNYCGIGPDLISFISDTTPIKQGKYSPGVHIPVLPYEKLQNGYPDTLLLFAWNHKTEIMEKESSFLEKGGEWIVYVPDVTLIRK